MKKSFQLSAVAIAIAASSSVMADTFIVDSTPGYPSTTTIDTDALNSVTTNSLNTTSIDLGTASIITTTASGASANRLTARYDTTDASGNAITVYETQSNGVSTYYTLDSTGTVATEYTDTGVISTLGTTVAPTAGGTTTAQSVVNTTNQTVKKVTNTAVTYGEISTEQEAVTVNGTLNNAENINVNVGTGAVVTTNNESVSTGIIGTDASGTNVYGTVATSLKSDSSGNVTANNTSTLTASGLTVVDDVAGTSTTVAAGSVTTGSVVADSITLAGTDLATTIANGDAATLVAANTYTDNQVAAEAAARVQGDADTLAAANTYTDNQVAVEAAARVQGDADTLAAANTYTDNQVAVEAAARVQGDADTLAAANTYTDNQVATEAAARAAGDQAIRDDIATKVTTNELEVNGAVTVNNVKSTTTVDQAGTPATTPEFGADIDGDGRPDTLIQTKEQTDAVTVSSQSQSYNENNLTFSSKVEKGTQTKTDQYTADIIYDANGVATYGSNVANGQSVTSDLETISEDSIIVGKETVDSETALTIRSKDANGESATVVTSKSVVTGNVTADSITLAGNDLATTIADGDAATLASANTYTNATATTLRGEAAAETTRVNKAIADGNTATLASANTYTDSKAVETLATANSYTNARVNQLNSRVDDVEKTAYRGIAIALAAQQAIPSIQPGQIAVFGGVGHYEGETAGAVGLVGALNDRTSLSAALGFAGGNEVGGRVGVAYVFGGK